MLLPQLNFCNVSVAAGRRPSDKTDIKDRRDDGEADSVGGVHVNSQEEGR